MKIELNNSFIENAVLFLIDPPRYSAKNIELAKYEIVTNNIISALDILDILLDSFFKEINEVPINITKDKTNNILYALKNPENKEENKFNRSSKPKIDSFNFNTLGSINGFNKFDKSSLDSLNKKNNIVIIKNKMLYQLYSL